MKNTFRKSSLISSVALLLVAIVALSGATFAWFSNNTTANAGTIDMTATSGSGIYIVDDAIDSTEAPTTGWSSKITWTNSAEKWVAVSGTPDATGGKFFTTGTDMADGTYNGETIDIANANESYIVKKIWVKADATGDQELTITPVLKAADGAKMYGYERIAIVDPAGTVYTMANSAEEWKAFTSNAGATTDASATAVESVTYTADYSEPQAFYLFCWFEGQDADCKNANGGANLTCSLNFTF